MKKQRTRLSKPRKIPQIKEHKLSDFVLSAGNIVGIEDDKYIRTRTGYIGILKVPGIDIVNFKKLDREIAQGAFGRALQSCGLAHKLVFVDYSPDYSSQIRFLRQRLRLVTHQYRRHLLERQIEWITHHQDNQSDRLSFIMLFAKTKEEIDDGANIYINAFLDAKVAITVCDSSDFNPFLISLLQGATNCRTLSS